MSVLAAPVSTDPVRTKLTATRVNATMAMTERTVTIVSRHNFFSHLIWKLVLYHLPTTIENL